MKVIGIDFTSAPKPKKRITCMCCTFEGGVLHANEPEEWSDFAGFEAMLNKPGPWIAGIDLPFGQSRSFIENIGWPDQWAGYVAHAESLGREGFVNALTNYGIPRSKGDKEHKRKTDSEAGSISPQKLNFIPVGKMFFEGAPRLLKSGVTIPVLQSGDPQRIVVEAYPGVLARQLIGRISYKNDKSEKQTEAQLKARIEIMDKILAGELKKKFGFRVKAEKTLAEDPTGDSLDALLCAMQAAWAWTQRENNYGAPTGTDPLEGWIAHPGLGENSAMKQEYKLGQLEAGREFMKQYRDTFKALAK